MTEHQNPRVLVAHPHGLIAHGVARLLAALAPDLDVKIVAHGPLLDVVQAERPAIVVAALGMRGTTLPDLPALSEAVPLVLLVDDATRDDAAAAVQAGASGVLDAGCSPDDLAACVRAVVSGGAWMPPQLQAVALRRLRQPATGGLTMREREVVGLVAAGLRNDEIARKLGVSVETVKKHLNRIFSKLAARDRVQLTLWGLRHGLAKAA